MPQKRPTSTSDGGGCDCGASWLWARCCCCASLCSTINDEVHVGLRESLLTRSQPGSSSSSSSAARRNGSEGGSTPRVSTPPPDPTAAMIYFVAVKQAFKQHFDEDEELRALWQDMGVLEATKLVMRAIKYREKRLRSGDVTVACSLHGTTVPVSGLVPSPVAPTCLCFSNPLSLRDAFMDRIAFAELAYEDDTVVLRRDLKNLGYELVSHEASAALFQPAFVVALHRAKRECLVAIKGTSTVGDMLTNLFIEPEYLSLRRGADEGEREEAIVHGGLAQGARFVLSRCGELVRVLAESGVRVVLVGHSLGAGVATVATVMLKHEYEVSNVECFAFAPPPAMGRVAADACRDYVFSVVNSDDVIPRTGVPPLKAFVASLCKLRDIQAMGGGDFAKVEVILDRIEWTKLETSMTELHVEKVYGTYVPGRILFAFGGGDLGPYRGVEVDPAFPPLRLPVLSKRMLSDHALDACRAALVGLVSVSSVAAASGTGAASHGTGAA